MLADTSLFNPVLHNDYEGFPDDSVVKNPPANTGHLGSIPGLASSSGEGNGNPLQYSCLGNLMFRGAWQAGLAKESDMT